MLNIFRQLSRFRDRLFSQFKEEVKFKPNDKFKLHLNFMRRHATQRDFKQTPIHTITTKF